MLTREPVVKVPITIFAVETTLKTVRFSPMLDLLCVALWFKFFDNLIIYLDFIKNYPYVV